MIDTARPTPKPGPTRQALAAARRVEAAIRLDVDETVVAFDQTGRDPFAPLPLAPTLRIDTTLLPPREAAVQIARHYDLPLIDADPLGS